MLFNCFKEMEPYQFDTIKYLTLLLVWGTTMSLLLIGTNDVRKVSAGHKAEKLMEVRLLAALEGVGLAYREMGGDPSKAGSFLYPLVDKSPFVYSTTALTGVMVSVSKWLTEKEEERKKQFRNVPFNFSHFRVALLTTPRCSPRRIGTTRESWTLKSSGRS